MNITAAKLQLQEVLSGPNAKHWAFGPAIKTLLDELSAAEKRATDAEALATQQGNIAVKLFDEVTQLRRNADDKAQKLYQRIAELEAREVELPQTIWYEHDDLPREIAVLEKRLVKKAIRAAGINIKKT